MLEMKDQHREKRASTTGRRNAAGDDGCRGGVEVTVYVPLLNDIFLRNRGTGESVQDRETGEPACMSACLTCLHVSCQYSIFYSYHI